MQIVPRPRCKTQDEVDEYWRKLSEGGEEGPCGWLKDKYGLSWQINPTILGEMSNDPDPRKAKRAMEAMLKMKRSTSPLWRKRSTKNSAARFPV